MALDWLLAEMQQIVESGSVPDLASYIFPTHIVYSHVPLALHKVHHAVKHWAWDQFLSNAPHDWLVQEMQTGAPGLLLQVLGYFCKQLPYNWYPQR